MGIILKCKEVNLEKQLICDYKYEDLRPFKGKLIQYTSENPNLNGIYKIKKIKPINLDVRELDAKLFNNCAKLDHAYYILELKKIK